MDTIPDFCYSLGPSACPLDTAIQRTHYLSGRWHPPPHPEIGLPGGVSMLQVAHDPWDKLLSRGLRDLASLVFRHGMDPESIYQRKNSASGWQAELSQPGMIKGFLRQGNPSVWRCFKTMWRKGAGWSSRSLLKLYPGYGLKQFLSLDYP